MRKICILLLAAALLCGTAFALDTKPAAYDATIKSLEGDYILAQDGSCTVLLTVEMEFAEGTQRFSLPVPAEARDLTVSAQGCTTARSGDTLLVTMHGAGQLADQTVLIGYTLPETVLATDDQQTCTLRLLLAARDCPIENYSAIITFPEEFEAMPAFESGYYGDLIENYLDIQIDDGVLSVRSHQAMRDHESLTMTLELPAGYFDLRFLAGKTAGVDRILFWVFLAAGLVYWALFLRNRFLIPKAEAMPPLASNAGAAPYLVTGSSPDLALMVMQWASLGYLTLTRKRGGKVLIQKQMDMGSERKSYEVQIFRDLFARGETLRAPCDDYRMTRTRTPALAQAYWEIRLFAVRAGKPLVLRILGAACGAALFLLAYDRLIPAQGWRWFVIVPLVLLGALACWLLQPVSSCFLRRRPGRTLALAVPALIYILASLGTAGIGLMTFLCVLFQLLIGQMLALGGRRTRRGLRQAEQLLGLRRYLLFSKPEKLREPLIEDPQYFYRTLPYAEALRVGGRFVRKFDGQTLEPCTWLAGERGVPTDAAAFYELFRSVLDTLREQTDAPMYNLLRNLRRKKRAKL